MEIGYVILKSPEGKTTCVRYGGTKLLSYTYDAWGNCTVTGSTTTGAQYSPFRYRGYYYDSEIGFYYLNSRYYDPSIGRFVNADVYVSTGQGLLGYNVFAYCRNEPVFRKDAYGTEDVCVTNFDDDNNPLNDLGKSPGGGSSGNGSYGGSKTSTAGTKSVRTEIHHVVEQCQAKKSGFSNDQIQANSNKVPLKYNVHRKISGFYSSKPPEYGGLRVRDWLAGQSFEFQTRFGWEIIERYR